MESIIERILEFIIIGICLVGMAIASFCVIAACIAAH